MFDVVDILDLSKSSKNVCSGALSGSTEAIGFSMIRTS